MTERIKKIYFPVFEYTITVVVTDDIAKSRASRNEEIGGVCKFEKVAALHSSFNERSWIFFNEGASINDITHESFHAIYALNTWINAEVEQEYFAFHQGYLNQEIFDFINLKPNKNGKEKKEKRKLLTQKSPPKRKAVLTTIKTKKLSN